MINQNISLDGFGRQDMTRYDNEPQWLRARRVRAEAALAAMSFPTPDEEVWRYSRVEEVQSLGLAMELALPVVTRRSALWDGIPELAVPLAKAAGMFVLVSHGKAEFYTADESQNFTFGPSGDFSAEVAGQIDSSDDYFNLFAKAFSNDTYSLVVKANAVIEAPIVVCYAETATGLGFLPHLIVSAGSSSSASLVEIFLGGNRESFLGTSAEVHLGEGARFSHFQIQDLDEGAFQSAFVESAIGAGAVLLFGAFSFGGYYARIRSESHLVGEGARAELKAAYFASDNQMLDFRTLQDHHSPNTYSDLLFKGAVAHKSHSVYSGLVRIEEGATRSDAFQTNRNLVLSDGARADSVPNLDIRENNVRCSHASAVGPIDPELVFYLASRGIEPGRAERIIVRGFFKEILEGINAAELVEIVSSLVAKRLEELD